MDETIVAWRPGATATGGLPNITHCPRKPKDLGTELRDAATLKEKVMVYLQIVKTPTSMRKLKYFGDTSSLPNGAPIGVAASEVLRTCEAVFGDRRDKPADAPNDQVVGDAWFGSLLTVIELFIRLGIYGTFVIKGGTKLFPKKQLLHLLRARFLFAAGNWVVMSATIAGVPVMAIAYGWSAKGVSFWVTTIGDCGNPQSYTLRYQNAQQEAESKEIPRPHILAHAHDALSPLHRRAEPAAPRQARHLRHVGHREPVVPADDRPARHLLYRSKSGVRRQKAAGGGGQHGQLFADLVLKNMDRLCQRFTFPPAAAAVPAGRGPLINAQMNNGTGWVTAIKTGTNATVQQRPCHVCKRHYVNAVHTGHACPKCSMPPCRHDWSKHVAD